MVLSVDIIQKSRKCYWCYWCGEKIDKGETYYRINGVYDGDFSSDSMHGECHQAWKDTDWRLHEEYTSFENDRGKPLSSVY